MTRRAAFDPGALDVDDILAPPPQAPLAPPRVVTPTAAPAAIEEPSAAPEAARRHKASTGGESRPTAAPVVPAAAVTVVPARLPRALYQAVVNHVLGTSIERPSYAQLVVWTIQDHDSEVLDELTQQLAVDARRPRGRRLASDVVPIAIRFHGDEIDTLNALTAKADGCTRTAAIIAAFRVAVRHAQQGAPA